MSSSGEAFSSTAAHSIATAQGHGEDDDSTSTTRSGGASAESSLLPRDFELTPYTVIIGRAKNVRDNLGNKRLKILASNYLDTYSGAKNDKRTKSLVVRDLYCAIKNAGGKFIKQCKGGRYAEVSESTAKDKIGYVLRDYLADDYPSTSKSKGIRRSMELIRKGSEKLTCALNQISSRTASSEQSEELTPNLATSGMVAAKQETPEATPPHPSSSGFRSTVAFLASFEQHQTANPTTSRSPSDWDDDEIDELFT